MNAPNDMMKLPLALLALHCLCSLAAMGEEENPQNITLTKING